MKYKLMRKLKKLIAVSLVLIMTLTSGIFEQFSSFDFSGIVTVEAEATYKDIPIGALSKIVAGYITADTSDNLTDISAYEIAWGDIEDLITALKYTYPLVFSAIRLSYYYYYKTKASDGSYIIGTIKLSSYDDISQYQTRFDELSEITYSILEGTDGMTDFEKIVYVYDYLILNVSYDFTYSKYSAYNALVEGTAVCEGYSQAFYLLMSFLNIECIVVDSYVMNHAWNMVELDGEWYHIDVTWGDYPDNNNDTIGRVEYSFLLLNDDEISALNHYSWVDGYTSTSTAYSNMPRTSNNLQTYSCDLWYYYDGSELYSCDQYGNDIEFVADITGDGIAIIEDVFGTKHIIYGSSTTLILQSLSDSDEQQIIFNIGSAYRFYSLFLHENAILYYYDNSFGYSTNESTTSKADSTKIELSKYLIFEIETVSSITATATSTTLDLSWNEVDGVTGYQIFINGEKVASVANGDTTYTVTSLESSTVYDVEICTFLMGTSVAFGENSATFSFTTDPSKVLINSATSDYESITLNWDEVDGADGYRIYEVIDGVRTIKKTLSASALTYTILDLDSDTEYTYQVKAFVRDINETAQFGEASDECVIKTNTTKAEIIYYISNSSSITIYWNEVIDADGYRVYVYQNGEWESVLTVESDINYYQLTQLEPETQYQFKVKAFIRDSTDTALWQEASETYIAMTKPISSTIEIFSEFKFLGSDIQDISNNNIFNFTNETYIDVTLIIIGILKPIISTAWIFKRLSFVIGLF